MRAKEGRILPRTNTSGQILGRWEFLEGLEGRLCTPGGKMVVFIPRVPYMQPDIRVLTSARCQVRVADLQLALLFQPPHPAIPHLPTCPTKTHPARKFAQFSSCLPNWSHFMAWCPRGWHSCHVAANVALY